MSARDFILFCGNKQAKSNDAEIATAATLCLDDKDFALNPLHCFFLPTGKLKAVPHVAALNKKYFRMVSMAQTNSTLIIKVGFCYFFIARYYFGIAVQLL